MTAGILLISRNSYEDSLFFDMNISMGIAHARFQLHKCSHFQNLPKLYFFLPQQI